jgi:hypothetical protein
MANSFDVSFISTLSRTGVAASKLIGSKKVTLFIVVVFFVFFFR